jgi:DNA-binding PadR family transcriptional regulator
MNAERLVFEILRNLADTPDFPVKKPTLLELLRMRLGAVGETEYDNALSALESKGYIKSGLEEWSKDKWYQITRAGEGYLNR